jgi:hypothetical protein
VPVERAVDSTSQKKLSARDREKQRNKRQRQTDGEAQTEKDSLKLSEFTSVSLASFQREYLQGKAEEMFAQKYLWKKCLDIHLSKAAINLLFSLTFCSQISFIFCCIIETINVIKRENDINNWPEISGFRAMRCRGEAIAESEKHGM